MSWFSYSPDNNLLKFHYLGVRSYQVLKSVLFQRAEMVVDTCKAGEGCHVGAALAVDVGGLKVMAPLQVGGMAHAPPHHLDHGWPTPITTNAFNGCIRNLRINGEVRGSEELR